PSVSSSRTPVISTFTLFDRSSCSVTASDSGSRVATLAAVHDPLGRNSSASPDGVAVNRGGVAKMFNPLQWEHLLSLGVSRAVDSKRELYVAHIVLDGIRIHFETET